MKRSLVTAILLIVPSPAFAADLCNKGEDMLWSCTATSGKIASICSSPHVSAQSGYIQYRFGKPGKLEMEFPATREHTQQQFLYARYTRHLVTMLSLSFTKDSHVYRLVTRDDDEASPSHHASIRVMFPDGRTVETHCAEQKSLIHVEDIVPYDPDPEF